MNEFARLSIALLAVAVLWMMVSAGLFVLRYAGTGVIPLSMPIGTLVLGAAFLAAYFRFRKLAAGRKPGKKEGKRK